MSGQIASARFFVPDSSDFIAAVSWTGADFTGADMVLTVSSDWGSGAQTLLTASTDNGRIRIADDGAGFSYFIPQAAIQDVPAGLQRLQQVSTQAGVSQTLFRGTWSTAVGAPPASSGPIVFDGFKAPIEFTDPAAVVQLDNTGQAGASAYQLWLASGGRGTLQDFLASLQGAPGPSSASGIAASDSSDEPTTVQALLDILLAPRPSASVSPALQQRLGVVNVDDALLAILRIIDVRTSPTADSSTVTVDSSGYLVDGARAAATDADAEAETADSSVITADHE